MRVKDISVGDLVKITEKSRVRPLLVDSIGGARMIRWVENNTHNEEELKDCKTYIVLIDIHT